MRSGREMTFTQKDTFDDLSGLSRTVCPRLSTPVRVCRPEFLAHKVLK